MSDDRPIPLSGVAELLGRSLNWTHRHIRSLRDKHGFPKPLPGVGLYDPVAIRAWKLGQQGGSVAKVSGNALDLVEVDWGALLDARAAELGARR